MSFWRRRGSLAASVSRHVVEAERRAKPLEAPIAAGTRVTVGPVHSPSTPRPDWQGALPQACEAPMTDGSEGRGEILAVDFDMASVRLDDGRTVLGVRRYRLRREET